MKRFTALRLLLMAGLVAGVTLSVRPLPAAVPAEEFLDGLRRRGYHDYALEYLSWMRTSDIVPDQLKRRIEYERAVTLIDQARRTPNPRDRERQFVTAEAEMKKFIDAQPEHELLFDALRQLGDLNMLRARLKMTEAEQASGGAAAALRDEAENLFIEARKVLESRLTMIRGRLVPINREPIPREDERFEMRQQLRNEFVYTRLLLANVDYEQAKVYAGDEKKYEEQLKTAAKAYEGMYESYRTTLAGLYARKFQSKCMFELGDVKNALLLVEDVLVQPDEPQEFRTLKTKAYRLAVEYWNESKAFDKAAEEGGRWLMNMRQPEGRDPDWLALRYVLAQSYEKMAAAADEPQAKREYNEEAMKLARQAAATPHPLQVDARNLLSRLRDEGGDRPEPTTFVDAKNRGDEYRDEVLGKPGLVALMRQRLESEKDPEEIEDLKKLIAEGEESLPRLREDALRYYRQALALATPDVNIDDVNFVRYSYCLMLFLNEDYYDAAVVGEFLARRYPHSARGQQAAQLAMRAWLQLFYAAGEDNEFEARKIGEVAEYITRLWDDPSVADDANLLLADLERRRGNAQKALEYLGQVSDDSPRLGPAFLNIGQLLGREYFETKRNLRGQEIAPEENERLEKLVQDAKEILINGIQRMEGTDQVTAPLIHAAYALSQIYADTSDLENAVKVLENETYGPLALIEAGHSMVQPPNFQQPGFSVAVHNLALRAYIGMAAGDPDKLARAEDMIRALEKLVSPEALANSYKQMARELDEQLQNAPPAQKQSIAEGFVHFLRKLRDGDSANGQGGAEDYNSLMYVLNAFLGLGEGFRDEGRPLSEQARGYYEEAASTARKILELADGKKLELTGDARQAIEIELARCHGRVGRYDEALDLYEQVLRERRNLLPVQIDAAKLLQQRGAEDSKYYRMALSGARPGEGRRNIIWGWSQLARIVRNHDHLQHVFHEAQYNQALCYYEAGMAESGENRQKYLGWSRTVIFGTYQHSPEMGGSQWAPRYDSLLRNIQRQLSQQEVGLQAFHADGGS